MKKWRAKYYRLALGRQRRLLLTVRRFHTNKARRSKKYRQLVVPVNIWGLSEVALRYERIITKKISRPKPFWSRSVSLPLLIIALGLSGMGYFGSQLASAQAVEPAHTFARPAHIAVKAKKSLPFSEPTHISIPSVDIDADIIQVGLSGDGSIQMPPLFSWQAGWYKYSPSPGQIGPAVIVGHVDNTKGTSVFWNLRKVQPGDTVSISRADGKTVKFKVTSLKQYDQSHFPIAKVYGNIDYAGIRIITCGGTFNHRTHSYDKNTVVSGVIVNH